MSQNQFVQPAPVLDRNAIVAGTPGVASAARWFWWIAALSLVNSALIHSGSETSFVIGLGFTLIADFAFQSVKAIAFVVDAVAIGFFLGVGWLALRGHLWAFILGGLVYLCDAAIYLYFQDFVPLAFHALALFYIFTGARALHGALRTAKVELVSPAAVPAP